jgi:hypothetical protein
MPKNAAIHSHVPMTILFYPDAPGVRWPILRTFCERKGWDISTDPNAPYDLAINWEDTTFRTQDEVLERLKQAGHVINDACSDISKRHTDHVHQEVFGYGLEVDPVAFEGNVVRKSDVNATHTGKILPCPITPEERDSAIAEGSFFRGF